MSGDVQPRKRKDKKRKKDDLGVSEPRGTAAALGDGDVFMHSHHEHGTGGHWCAKIVFFSLLAILVGLVGLIILENRGLSELEANAVQSQYSGVLEGWLEDAPENDHHDEHTLELNHHDDEDDGDHGDAIEHSEEAEDNENDHNDPQEDEDDEQKPQDDDNDEGSEEQDLEANDEDEELPYRKYFQSSQAKHNDDDEDDGNDHDYQENDDSEDENELKDDEQEDDDDSQKDQDDDSNLNYQEDDDDDQDDDDDAEGYRTDRDDKDNNEDVRNNQSSESAENSQENDEVDKDNDVNEYYTHKNKADSHEDNNEDDGDDDEGDDEDASLEVEKIEHEASDEEPISTELPALPEPDDDENDGQAQESAEEDGAGSDDDNDEDDTEDGEEDGFLEADDDEPPVGRITAPAGQPFDEVEEEVSSERLADTLEEEEEYEKRQEELRREEAQASHMWLKLTVGGALLVATHAIVRRATASSADEPQTGESTSEEIPAIDRRMTLIAEEPSESVAIRRVAQESTRPVVQDLAKQIPSIIKSSPTFEDSEDEVEEEEQAEPAASTIAQEKLELYSDEEEADEEIEEEEIVKKAAPQVAKQPTPKLEPEEDVPDDVEIIDDEIEEEAEEDEDEEEISDVDDEELLTRLEAKYGRLPEPERPPRHKDGGNSAADEWPGEPSDAYWRQQLDQAEREFNQGAWAAAAARAGAAPLRSSARARFLLAKALDAEAERKRDNALLGRAIAAYLELLKMNERLSDKKLIEITKRTIDRIQFRGNYLNAEPVFRLLIRRFPDDPSHRTNLTVTFLMANRADLAEEVLKETLKRWPDERLALAQYGFVLKTQHNRLEEAVGYLQRALEGDTGPATEPRYYYHLGDTLLLLGRFKEAEDVHERGAAHGHFLSPAQRSLYNVPRLRSQPWWKVEDTPYVKLVRSLEKSWRDILREGEAARALYEEEKEGLRERGEWGQLDLFVRGQEVPGRCRQAPVTCGVVKAEAAAARCRRGQAKFSVMQPGTHVRPHVGPTNCRLRMHLALANTDHTFLRVHRETRQWKVGEVLIFDDSFEHEVWHNGTGARLVLIVDVWHPDLTPHERRTLPAI